MRAWTLSTDRLQVLSEFVQNSYDAGAGQLRILLRSEDTLIAHGGAGLRLADVLPLGLPWLSGKTASAGSTRRFGIGLAALRALTAVWEVHCQPLPRALLRHEPRTRRATASARRRDLRTRMDCLPHSVGTGHAHRSPAPRMVRGLERRLPALPAHLRRLEVTAGEHSTVLSLSWEDMTRRRLPINRVEPEVYVQHARAATDGALWRVYTAQVAAHPDWERSHKALSPSVPMSVVLWRSVGRAVVSMLACPLPRSRRSSRPTLTGSPSSGCPPTRRLEPAGRHLVAGQTRHRQLRRRRPRPADLAVKRKLKMTRSASWDAPTTYWYQSSPPSASERPR